MQRNNNKTIGFVKFLIGTFIGIFLDSYSF